MFFYIINDYQEKYKLKINNYLDIGCGNCKLTENLGTKLGLKNSNIYGVDLASFAEQNDWDRKNLKINFEVIKENKKLPFKDNKFSVISLFMVLHHVKNLDLMFRELYRILKKDGIIIIREHDAYSYADKMLCDIEHILYSNVYTNKKYNKKFIKTYYGKYFSWLEWEYLFDKYGFKYISSDYTNKSSYFELTETRSFYSIFKK